MTSRSAAQNTGPQITLMGTHVWGGPYGNLGVNALCCGSLSLLSEAFPNATFALAGTHSTPNPTVQLRPGESKIEIPIVRWRLSIRCPHENLVFILFLSVLYRVFPVPVLRTRIERMCPWIRQITGSRFVADIWGGDSFSDIYGPKRFIGSCFAAFSVFILGRPYVLLPQTYGPYKASWARALARSIVKRAKVVIARDEESRKVAESLLDGKKVELTPDVAFRLRSEFPADACFALFHPSARTTPLFGLNVNGLMFNGGYTRSNMFGLKLDYRRFVGDLIKKVLDSDPKISVALIPHTITQPGSIESDNDANDRIYEALPAELQKRVFKVDRLLDCHQTKGLIGACDFFVGSRMHSCIAALSQGVPCVGVAYSMKFSGVFASVGMRDHVIDGRTATSEETVEQIMQHFAAADSRRPELARRSDAARDQLRMVSRSLITLL